MSKKRGGYTRSYRSILTHNALTKPIEKWAFSSLILSAAWKDCEQRCPNSTDVEIVKRGQFMTSERQLMELWGSTRHQTRQILKLMKSQQMIELETNHQRTVITLCNYNDFQGQGEGVSTADQPQLEQRSNNDSNNESTTKERILKNLKKLKELKSAGARGILVFSKVENPCPDLINGATWKVWCEHDIVELNLEQLLSKNEELAA